MLRSARIVVPDVPHHIVQRGNRQLPIFFSNADWQRYLDMLAEAGTAHRVRCLAWCLMDNHVHLILVPPTADSLRAVLSSTQTRYAQRVNQHQHVSGHLFQGRYASYAMDEAHLMVAVRYVENIPVEAGLGKRRRRLALVERAGASAAYRRWPDRCRRNRAARRQLALLSDRWCRSRRLR